MRNGLLPGLVVAALLAVPVSFAAISESDAGWHLAMGRLIVAQRSIGAVNAITWTYPDAPWAPTSWAFDVGIYLAARLFGPIGIQLGVWLLVLAAVALASFAAARVSPRSGFWMAPLTALLLLPRATSRPHVVSWVVLAAVLLVCLQARTRGPRHRWWTVAILAVGFNFHSGAIFGAAVAGTFSLVDAVRERAWRREAAFLGGLAIAALLNPGVAAGLTHAAAHLSVNDVISIAEFEHIALARSAVFVAITAIAMLGAITIRHREPAFLILVSVFAVFAWYANRIFSEFAIVAIPAIAAALEAMAEAATRRRANLGLALGTMLVLWSRSDFVLDRPLSAHWDPLRVPVRAVDYLVKSELGPHGFSGFSDGGYVEWMVGDDAGFVDARIPAFPADFLRRVRDSDGQPEAFRAMLDEYGVAWAMTSVYWQHMSGYRLLDDPAWALVYRDASDEVYLRRADPRFARLIRRDEYLHFRPYGRVLGPIETGLRADVLAHALEVERYLVVEPDDAIALIVRCAATHRLDSPGVAEACAAAQAVVAPGNETKQLARARLVTAIPQ